MKRTIFWTVAVLISTTSIASARDYGYGGGTSDIDARQARQEA